MQLTLQQLCSVVQEELGRSPSKGTCEALINEAGERWVNAENWRYLRNRTQEVLLTPGVEFYRLGAGIHSLGNTIHRPNSVWSPIHIMDEMSFTAYRERYLSGIERPYQPVATTNWDVRVDPAGKEDDRRYLYLQIYPARLTETVVIEYNGGWVPLDNLDDVVDMPPPLVVHFRDWVRIYALHREFPEMYPIGTLDAFMQSSSFVAAQRKDAETVGTLRVQPGNIGTTYRQINLGRAFRSNGPYGRYKAFQHYYERGGFD